MLDVLRLAEGVPGPLNPCHISIVVEMIKLAEALPDLSEARKL